MYRLVLYYLITLIVAAAIFGFIGILPYSPADIAFSTLLILAVCYLTNTLFAKGFDALPNSESVYITALILALIITPVAPTDYAGLGFVVFASAWAMAAKYLFAIGKKHLFNPASFGVALGALVLTQSASWWVGGNLPLMAFVIVGGLLIVRKIRRFDLVIAFSFASLITIGITSGTGGPATAIWQTFLHSSFFFLAFVMLTEPLTMPPSRWLRVVYGAIVGFLFAPNIHIGSFYLTPELALLIGNIFAYSVSPKGRYMLRLLEKNTLAADTFEFLFAPDHPITFKPGQYIEWTLATNLNDTRGNRRYFTIASSPTEPEVRLGVKFYKPASTFKRALWALPKDAQVSASHIAGDFTMPSDTKKKLVFIAGGIGVTPFRSMAQYLIDTNEKRDIVLLYSNKTASEVAYADVFARATEKIGMRTIYALTNEPVPVPDTHNGFIDAELIKREIPDYTERQFYISGPHSMVDAFTKTLRGMGVSRFSIKTDYFPGFA